MKKSIASIIVGLSLTLSACSTYSDGGNAVEKWRNYQDETISASNVPDDRALAVFYRNTDENKSAINIYIDGDYQGALLQNSFTQISVCKDNVRFTTSYSTNQKFGNRLQGNLYSLPSQQISYFRMVENNNGLSQPYFEQVSETQAKEELSSLKGATQNISRVQPKCDDRPAMKATFDAGALFAFDKFALLQQGKTDLAQFAENVKKLKGLKSIDRIEVSGYTDPSGKPDYNLALSQKRADIVRQKLLQEGVQFPISAKGYGATNFVVADCRAKFPSNVAVRRQCDQSNRRVEIKVYGTAE